MISNKERGFFEINLYDNESNCAHFFAGWVNGVYKETDTVGELSGHTHVVTINSVSQGLCSITIDGDAWRDVDASDSLSELLLKASLPSEKINTFLEMLHS